MSCNCKNGDSFDTELKNEKKVSLWNNIINYFFKTLGFIILLAFLPIINLVIIWIMFKVMVLNKKLEKYKQPDAFYLMPELPLGGTGKADRGQFKNKILANSINPVFIN